MRCAIRISANDSLERDIAELPTLPVGRPSHKPVVRYKGFLYQAESWTKARRVVALERQDFPVLDFSGRATTAPCGGEDGSRREKLQHRGSKEGDWVYTGPKPGSEMEIPGECFFGVLVSRHAHD